MIFIAHNVFNRFTIKFSIKLYFYFLWILGKKFHFKITSNEFLFYNSHNFVELWQMNRWFMIRPNVISTWLLHFHWKKLFWYHHTLFDYASDNKLIKSYLPTESTIYFQQVSNPVYRINNDSYFAYPSC